VGPRQKAFSLLPVFITANSTNGTRSATELPLNPVYELLNEYSRRWHSPGLSWKMEKGECRMLKKAEAGTESRAEKILYFCT
jgi:hypothetical protein